MRYTPSQDHLEAWCHELSFAGRFLEAPREILLEAARVESRDARRLAKVAYKTNATKARKRARRWAYAQNAKARQSFLEMCASAVQELPGLEVLGDLPYDLAHSLLSSAQRRAAAWTQRQAVPLA